MGRPPKGRWEGGAEERRGGVEGVGPRRAGRARLLPPSPYSLSLSSVPTSRPFPPRPPALLSTAPDLPPSTAPHRPSLSFSLNALLTLHSQIT
ncbi:hypothetical protein K523DRAFT_320103, partial [Schizophyllum commune Tattone D]